MVRCARTINSVATQVEEFIGVYDADGTIVGEVSYWIGARLGRTHCSLCELTHGLFTVKREWRVTHRDYGSGRRDAAASPAETPPSGSIKCR